MSNLLLTKGLFPQDFFQPTIQFLLDSQQDDGAIPWFDGGYADPWDHVEAAMGLTIGGEYAAAEKAYLWLRNMQLPDGSWWAAYKDGEIHNRERRETNFVAYIATGVWHYYLVTGNIEFAQSMWATVTKAIDFVLSLQTRHGDIHWAVDVEGKAMEDALITGCSSIYKSLECAVNLSVVLGDERKDWLESRVLLGNALRFHPERFDRTWEPKTRFSMDWFYPVLSGALPAHEGKKRLQSRWDQFVEEGMGCRCVSDEPWVTMAESSELVMALLAAGDHARAVKVFSWLHEWRLEDGSYWTGYQFVENVLWPDEKPTWTAAAILLAADALTDYTSASHLFKEVRLLDTTQNTQRIHHL